MTVMELYNEDCITGMDWIKDKSVDVVVTSPPYNIGAKYSSYNDNVPLDQYLQLIESATIQIKRVLKDQGSFPDEGMERCTSGSKTLYPAKYNYLGQVDIL
jgi:site-specific DNA-methyltransferase (adenine-specific)